MKRIAEYTEYAERENVNVWDSAYFAYSAVQKIEAVLQTIEEGRTETNPKFEVQTFKASPAAEFGTFQLVLNFEFVSDFGFRISDLA